MNDQEQVVLVMSDTKEMKVLKITPRWESPGNHFGYAVLDLEKIDIPFGYVLAKRITFSPHDSSFKIALVPTGAKVQE